MTCPEFVGLLSSRIDGDLTPSQRDRIEAHLQTCADCRRSAAQMERAVAWVRGLDRLPAPPRATRLAHLPPVRRSAWSAFRPVALAASAVLAALVAWEGFESLVPPPPSASTSLRAPAGATDATGGSSTPNPTSASPASGSASTPTLPVPAGRPDRPSGLDLQVVATLPEEPAAPGRWVEANPTGESAGEEPVYVRIQGGRPPTGEGDRVVDTRDDESVVPPPAQEGAAGTDRVASSEVGTTVWVVGPGTPAPAPQAPAPPAVVAGRPATASRVGSAQPSDAAPRPVATEVAASVPIIAWMDGDAVRFGDPGDGAPGELVRAGEAGATTEGATGSEPVRQIEDIPRPGADPRTGVTPPVPVERPRAVLPAAPDPEVWRLFPPLSLQVTIAADGKVLSVSPLPWPGPAAVVEALMESVRGWTFLPAERAGEALASRAEVTIEFDAR